MFNGIISLGDKFLGPEQLSAIQSAFPRAKLSSLIPWSARMGVGPCGTAGVLVQMREMPSGGWTAHIFGTGRCHDFFLEDGTELDVKYLYHHQESLEEWLLELNGERVTS